MFLRNLTPFAVTLVPFSRGRNRTGRRSIPHDVAVVQRESGATEESKVKLEQRVSLLSDLKKRGASRGCAFLLSIFKEHAPSQSGECSLLRWFWSFHRRESGAAARTGAAIVVCAVASFVVDWRQHLLGERQIESFRRTRTALSLQRS